MSDVTQLSCLSGMGETFRVRGLGNRNALEAALADAVSTLKLAKPRSSAPPETLGESAFVRLALGLGLHPRVSVGPTELALERMLALYDEGRDLSNVVAEFGRPYPTVVRLYSDAVLAVAEAALASLEAAGFEPDPSREMARRLAGKPMSALATVVRASERALSVAPADALDGATAKDRREMAETIAIDAEVGCGTEITIFIPVVRADGVFALDPFAVARPARVALGKRWSVSGEAANAVAKLRSRAPVALPRGAATDSIFRAAAAQRGGLVISLKEFVAATKPLGREPLDCAALCRSNSKAL
jgi:hypothetical protein